MNTNTKIAKDYYAAMLSKDFDKMASYLHEDVQLIGPLAELFGKQALVLAAKNLSGLLEDIEFRSEFASNNQIMFAYDFIFLKPIGKLRSAVLMDFNEQLISKIELFYDGRPFVEKSDEIFNG